MKRSVFLLVTLLGAGLAWAQTQPAPPPNSVIGRPAPQPTYANPAGPGNPAFTNQWGQTFSMADLDSQLRALQSAVNQTLPMLGAVNNELARANAGGTQGWRGLVSRLWPQGGNAAAGQTSPGVSNFLGVLHGLVNTNNPNAVGINPNTISTLQTLQKDLEPIPPLLQSLNVGAPGQSPAAAPGGYGYGNPYPPGQSPYAGYPARTNYPGAGVSPTGR
jgi:hypothetical protein